MMESQPEPAKCHSKRPIVWQVFLGANTPKRLSNELGISAKTAWDRLDRAAKAGYIKRISKGMYSAIR